MTQKGVVPWIYEDDPELRLALASEVFSEMKALVEHPGWARLCDTIDQMIVAARDKMESTGQNIEQLRGGLKALRKVRGIPEHAIERANAELALHRGD